MVFWQLNIFLSSTCCPSKRLMQLQAQGLAATGDANSSLWMPRTSLAGKGLAGWLGLGLETLKQCHRNPQPKERAVLKCEQ